MTIALTNAARAALKKALRGKVVGLDTMTKAELLAAAASHGLDVATIASEADRNAPVIDVTPHSVTTQEHTMTNPTISADSDKAAKAAKLAALLADLAGDRAAPLDEARVIDLIQQHAPKGETRDRFIVREVKGEPAPDRTLPDMPRHEVFPEVFAAISAGCNVLLVGPAGSGKTTLCRQVAEALDLDFRFTGAVDSPYKLTGFVDAQGRYVRTPFRDAVEHGGLFLWDELDGSAPGALLPFNAGLENAVQDFPDGCIPKHEKTVFIASANTYGRGADRQYVGRNQLDAATMDRFVVIDMDYDEKLEKTLYGDTEWTAYVHKVRAAARKLNIRLLASGRAIRDGHKLLAAGMKLASVKRAALYKGLDAGSVAKVEAETGA